TTLQIQHYGIYPAVGREGFAQYMKANNRASALPTIVPGILLVLVSAGLVVSRPAFVTNAEGVEAFALNFFAFMSTLLWQRRLQGEMAVTGYDEAKVRLLIRTNWIRVVCYWLQGALAISIVVRVMRTGIGAQS
ncbi:MAG: hypothetical protein ACXV49_10510, partial [Halobacteriota archaeon]